MNYFFGSFQQNSYLAEQPTFAYLIIYESDNERIWSVCDGCVALYSFILHTIILYVESTMFIFMPINNHKQTYTVKGARFPLQAITGSWRDNVKCMICENHRVYLLNHIVPSAI